nr:hypothetical protein [Actinomadura logoneensis]
MAGRTPVAANSTPVRTSMSPVAACRASAVVEVAMTMARLVVPASAGETPRR